MWFLFPIFLFGELFMLNITDILGKMLHPSNIKFSEILQENVLGLYHHILSSIFLSYIMYYNNWCLNSDGSISFEETIKCSHNSSNQLIYMFLVMFEVSHYIISIVNTLLWKTVKRNDQPMLFMHHIIAIGLIYGGTIFKLGEFGTIYILFTHNLCDIPIHIYLFLKNIKCANTNITFNERIMSVIDNINGVVLIIMWAYLRLYMYGSLSLGIIVQFPEETNIIMKVFVGVLYIFDVIWFYMTIKSVYNEVVLGKEKSVLYDSSAGEVKTD